MDTRAVRHILPAVLLSLLVPAMAQTPPPANPAAAAQAAGIQAALKAPRGGSDDILPVEQAFRFDAIAQGSDRVRLNWEIADGDYLYRSRIKISTSSAEAHLGNPQFPAGQIKNDEYFGRQEIYHHELSVILPVSHGKGGAISLPLKVTYQGCSESAGICYPPVTREVTLELRTSS
jgi:thioredoxin:protein disulfide reductase